MRIIDANLIIYFAQPEKRWLRSFIENDEAHYSTLTKVEVLGFHRLDPRAKILFDAYFEAITPLPPTNEVIECAIQLRQSKKMSLGDAILAATALVYDLDIYTHNVTDFSNIPGLRVVDPMR